MKYIIDIPEVVNCNDCRLHEEDEAGMMACPITRTLILNRGIKYPNCPLKEMPKHNKYYENF